MKEYLLLRNNKQSGPYSINDLEQLGLKAFDLIWIDKKSSAWKYPSEIKELAAFVPSANTDTNTANTTVQKVINIIQAASLSKTGADHYEYNNQSLADVAHPAVSHVVTLQPTVNHTRIRTIKSSSSRNIIQVQVRTEDALPTNAAALTGTKAEITNSGYAISPEHNNILAPFSKVSYQATPEWGNIAVLPSKNQYISDNKLELAVLIIGAISLLAIVFLLVTSPY